MIPPLSTGVSPHPDCSVWWCSCRLRSSEQQVEVSSVVTCPGSSPDASVTVRNHWDFDQTLLCPLVPLSLSGAAVIFDVVYVFTVAGGWRGKCWMERTTQQLERQRALCLSFNNAKAPWLDWPTGGSWIKHDLILTPLPPTLALPLPCLLIYPIV